MLSYKKPGDRESFIYEFPVASTVTDDVTTVQESLIYDIPVTTTTDDVTVQESLVHDLPMATTTSDDVITVDDNAAYAVFKK